MEKRFSKGSVDTTLFLKKHKHDMLIAQIYVDDILFGVTNQDLCEHFAKEMQNEFKTRMMGELTFFLIYKSSNARMESSSTKLNTSRIY